MHVPSVLIIKPSSLGDIVHGLLVAQMIKSGHPTSRIDWVSRDIFAPLVRACPVVDDVLIFERHGGPTGFLRLIRSLRRRRYTHVLDMQGLARSGLIALASRADLVVGRSDAREGTKFLYNRCAPLPAEGRQAHAVAILSEFLPLLGLPRDIVPRLAFRLTESSFGPVVKNGLATHSVQRVPPRPCPIHRKAGPIVLFPESSRAEKNWSGFGALTQSLVAKMPDTRVVWAGARPIPGPGEHPEARFANLTGKTALSELPALLGQARLVIGNDSGPLHLAAALGVPTLALFGPTNPDRYRPYPGDDRQNLVQRAPGGDMGLLQPEAVLVTVRAMLKDAESD